jgi:hypothetical protein
MAFAVVDICNRALQQIGANPITDIDDNNKNARECKYCYDSLRQALLQSHWWNFSTVFASLPALASPANPPPANSIWSGMFTYQLPSDFLKLVSISDYIDGWMWNGIDFMQGEDYMTQNGTIITWVQAPLNLRYVKDFTNVNDMSPLFREALAMYMAQEMAERITQSNPKKVAAGKAMSDVLSQARLANAFDKPASKSPVDEWITVRR